MSVKNDCVGKSYNLPAQTEDVTIPSYLDKLQLAIENLDSNLEILLKKLTFVSKIPPQQETKNDGQVQIRASECVENIKRKTEYVDTLSQIVIKATIDLDL